MNAADSYAMMVKQQIAPSLRQLGWRGSGQVYRRPDPGGAHVQLGFQRSVWNTRKRVAFTMNVSVFSQAEWSQLVGADAPSLRPSPNSHYGKTGWQARIGHLVLPSADHWWRVWSPRDVEPVAREVLDVVRSVVQPQIEARLAGTQPPPASPWLWTAPHWRDDIAQAALLEVDEAKAWGGAPLPQPVHLQSLQRARAAVVERAHACRLLRVEPWNLDHVMSVLGTGDRLGLLELFVVAAMRRVSPSPSLGAQVREVLGRWLDEAPHLPADTTLVTTAETAQLLPYGLAQRRLQSSQDSVSTPIVPVLCVLLDGLDAADRG